MPALPLDEAGKYVAAAYVAFLALLLVYVAIMAVRLQRIDRELGELADLADGRRTEDPGDSRRQAAAQEVARGEAEGQGFERSSSTHANASPAGSGREAEHSGGGVP